jgi:hypothetical protein
MSSAAIENFVMNVRTLSGQGNFTDLNDFLQKNMDVLVRNPAHLGTVMETLDIQQHSLGVLAVSVFKNIAIIIYHHCIENNPLNLGHVGQAPTKPDQRLGRPV